MTSHPSKGIDVSRYQGVIDWKKVRAAGINFAVAKATEGSNYEDPKFLDNMRGIKNNNFLAGAYHYLRGAQDVSSQVDNVKRVLNAGGFDAHNDVLAIDVEELGNESVSPDKMADTLDGVLVELSKTFHHIYIYCSPSYWENKVAWKKYNTFSRYKLWIAHYTDAKTPIIPSTWKSEGYTWWQYTDKGSVDGITGHVDLDRSK